MPQTHPALKRLPAPRGGARAAPKIPRRRRCIFWSSRQPRLAAGRARGPADRGHRRRRGPAFCSGRREGKEPRSAARRAHPSCRAAGPVPGPAMAPPARGIPDPRLPCAAAPAPAEPRITPAKRGTPAPRPELGPGQEGRGPGGALPCAPRLSPPAGGSGHAAARRTGAVAPPRRRPRGPHCPPGDAAAAPTRVGSPLPGGRPGKAQGGCSAAAGRGGDTEGALQPAAGRSASPPRPPARTRVAPPRCAALTAPPPPPPPGQRRAPPPGRGGGGRASACPTARTEGPPRGGDEAWPAGRGDAVGATRGSAHAAPGAAGGRQGRSPSRPRTASGGSPAAVPRDTEWFSSFVAPSQARLGVSAAAREMGAAAGTEPCPAPSRRSCPLPSHLTRGTAPSQTVPAHSVPAKTRTVPTLQRRGRSIPAGTCTCRMDPQTPC